LGANSLLSSYDLGRLTKGPFEKISPEAIRSGFRSTGIHPLNRDVVLSKIEDEEERTMSTGGKRGEKRKNQEEETVRKRVRTLEAECSKMKLEIAELWKKMPKVQVSEKEKERKRSFNNEALSLTKDETIQQLEAYENSKKEVELMKEKKRQERADKAQTKQEEKEKRNEKKQEEKKRREEKKWEDLHSRGLKQQENLAVAAEENKWKATLTNYVTKLRWMGELQEYPEVFLEAHSVAYAERRLVAFPAFNGTWT